MRTPRVILALVASVATGALLSPADLSAQRLPLPGITKRPGRPADLPPQPTPIARELQYRRWRLSVESYPLVSFVQAPGLSFNHAMPSFATFGTGTRADYLLTRNISATYDMTASIVGGPAHTYSGELGTRLHPEWAEHRLHPYVDLRAAYLVAYDSRLGTSAYPFTDPFVSDQTVVRYSRGFGAVGGVGVEYPFTARWSLTTAGSVFNGRMRAHDFDAPSGLGSFRLTSFRYTLGVRYTPIRIVQSALGTDIR